MSDSEKERLELIFTKHAKEYQELVAAEDRQGNLPRALCEITTFAGKTVVELGAGTGRVTMLVAPWAEKVLAFEASQHMMDAAAANIHERGLGNVTFTNADNRKVPLPDASADIVIEGWSFGFTVSRGQSQWRNEADALLAESERLLKPGGTLIIIETLGTGSRMPSAPGAILPIFYGYMERQLGFANRWIRTDYCFSSLVQARRLMEMFFGRMVDYDLAGGFQVIIPECTGIWWKAF